MEDIAVTEMQDNYLVDIAREEVEFLRKICHRNALRPTKRHEPVEFYDESPFDCYERVLKYYDRNKLAEFIDKQVLAEVNANNAPETDPKIMANLPVDTVLARYKSEIISNLAIEANLSKNEARKMLNWNFKQFRRNFALLEGYVNLAANCLEKIGFKREKEEKYRSRLHDVSHIIYAAHVNIFVTDDKKLNPKAKAIYYSIDVPTQVMNKKEFIEYALNLKKSKQAALRP
ncbi:hypothetical protein [Neisseria sp. CCUG12390]|uniref:hypothetical protein n=1 Tax=Neisseria sp. CCUG12390 TaxID=3392035 RepID=UPI003A1009A4